MIYRLILFLGLIIAASSLGGSATAATIAAKTVGRNNLEDPSFYRVSFKNGDSASFVRSITYDLSPDANAFFDFDGSDNFGNASEPILNLASLVGLNASDISFVPNGSRPSQLTFNFAPGTFGVGDSFRFGTDTDFLVSDPAPGSVFGDAGVIFQVALENGETATSVFQTVKPRRSKAIVVFTDTEPIPTPALLPGLIGMGAAALRKRKRETETAINHSLSHGESDTLSDG